MISLLELKLTTTLFRNLFGYQQNFPAISGFQKVNLFTSKFDELFFQRTKGDSDPITQV
jgi:hypothetical protein